MILIWRWVGIIIIIILNVCVELVNKYVKYEDWKQSLSYELVCYVNRNRNYVYVNISSNYTILPTF